MAPEKHKVYKQKTKVLPSPVDRFSRVTVPQRDNNKAIIAMTT